MVRQRTGAAALSLVGLAFGITATFLWVAFLIFLGWSVSVLLATGSWPNRPLNFYHPQIADPYGSVWLGWYLLGGIILAMLGSFGCALANRRKK